MEDWLLFLHLLAAVALVATVVVFSAVVLGAAVDSRILAIANVLWAVGGLGSIVFGIWLALDLDGYDILDGWIIAAIALWGIATELGRRAQLGFTGPSSGAGSTVVAGNAALMHWLRSLVVLALLVVMIYKPGA